VHIARPECYHPGKLKWREAKYVFYLEPGGAVYGFYIEKKGGAMDETWDWLRFIEGVEREGEVCEGIEEAMRLYGVRWEIWVGGGLAGRVVEEEGALWWEGGDRKERISWGACWEVEGDRGGEMVRLISLCPNGQGAGASGGD